MRKGIVSVRFTPDEVQQVREEAGRQKLTLSEFIRRCVSRAAHAPGFDRKTGIGWSSDGKQYTKYARCGDPLGGLSCGRERGHDGPHQSGSGLQWSDT